MTPPALTLPPVIGHRGAAGRAPENTLAGFAKAAELGLKWVELDARLTADGRCVVFHDDTLARIGGLNRRLADTTLAELAQVDAGAWFAPAFRGERIPTLEEALAAIARHGLGVNVELKRSPGQGGALVQGVAQAIASAWPRGAPSPLLSSFEARLVAEAARLMPALPRALLVERAGRGWWRAAGALGCAAVHCRAERLTRSAAAEIKAQGFVLAAFVVDDAERAKTLWDWGVDAVFSDAPEGVLAAAAARRRA